MILTDLFRDHIPAQSLTDMHIPDIDIILQNTADSLVCELYPSDR